MPFQRFVLSFLSSSDKSLCFPVCGEYPPLHPIATAWQLRVFCICNDHGRSEWLYFLIQCLKSSAVMFISRVNAVSQNPSMLITCGFDCICKDMLMFSFWEPAAYGITCAAFCVLAPSEISSEFSKILETFPPDVGGWWFFLSFNGFFL